MDALSRDRRARMAIPFSIALAMVTLTAVLLAACGDVPAPKLTSTPIPYNPTQGPITVLTPTTMPIAPAEEGPEIRDAGVGSAGVSNPTQAGLAAEGQPEQDLPTSTPRATQAHFPMMIGTSDGLLLAGDYYSAALRPAPGILLLHEGGKDRHDWEPLTSLLQNAGYAVLAIDLRGYGDSGGTPDWMLARDDVKAALSQLGELPSVDPGNLIVIAAGIGANLGLNACAESAGCMAAVLLSPGLDYQGISTSNAMVLMGSRAVLIAASDSDDNNPADSIMLDGMAQGTHRLDIYPGAVHGTDLLTTEPSLVGLIVEWLAATVPPPALAS